MQFHRKTVLTGPRGTFANGERVARSEFRLVTEGHLNNTRTGIRHYWQWIAFDDKGGVLTVKESCCILNEAYEALWKLRAFASWCFHQTKNYCWEF